MDPRRHHRQWGELNNQLRQIPERNGELSPTDQGDNRGSPNPISMDEQRKAAYVDSAADIFSANFLAGVVVVGAGE